MKYAKIGGQAVLEGVMMRYGDAYAVTVRRPDGELETMTGTYVSLGSRLHVKNIPIVRGVFSFIDSLVLGMSTLMWSSSFYEEEDSQDAKPPKKHSELWENLMMAATVVLAIVLAVGLFMILPFLVSDFCGQVISSTWVLGIIEGVVRILIFLAYVIGISFMSDIRRTYMYHGAEHKTINCIEHGEELTPENAMKHSRFHKRCGTSFMFLVIFLSVVFFVLFFQIFPVESRLLKIVIRILLVPLIAGISYEILQWSGRSEGKLSDLISTPGTALQKFTTQEPDLSMLETAIASIEAIYDWRAFQEEVNGINFVRETPASGEAEG